jgi:hypothetical protein
MATPPAVAAICPNKPGWRPWGAATGAGADGGGRVTARVGGGGGLEEEKNSKINFYEIRYIPRRRRWAHTTTRSTRHFLIDNKNDYEEIKIYNKTKIYIYIWDWSSSLEINMLMQSEG